MNVLQPNIDAKRYYEENAPSVTKTLTKSAIV